MSTKEFATALTEIDFSDSKGFHVFSQVDFDEEAFVALTEHQSYPLQVIPSNKGRISYIVDNPDADPNDHSQTTRFFDMHKDGLYLEKIPPPSNTRM